MANNVNNDAQLQRMKALMNYGINESKQPVYSTVEYNKVAADGKLYGIVREGVNYFIKVAKNAKGGLVSENFEYIGGFRNRKDNMFESFAAAQRYFGEKMITINEEVGSAQKQVIAESYINEKKEVAELATTRMQEEIARQRQIMENAQRIMENKEQTCKKPVVAPGVKDNSKSPKCTAEKPEGEIRDYNNKKVNAEGGNIFNIDPSKALKESSETPLSSRKNPDFMDKSHGTEIGKVTGFGKTVEDKPEGAVADENGGDAVSTDTPENVNEETAMHLSQNQNAPAVGVAEKGDEAPFDEKANVNESLDDMEDDLDDDVDGAELDGEFGDDVDSIEGDTDGFSDDAELDTDTAIEDAAIDADSCEGGDCDDMAARMDSLEAKLDSILDAINNMKYDDDEELYDNEAGEMTDGDDDAPIDADDTEDGFEGAPMGDEPEMGDEEMDSDDDVMESKSYAKMKKINEANKLNDFGAHPAYQKTVMSLPSNQNQKNGGQYDMNDESLDGEKPYGTQKGKNGPFTQSREKVENEIVESVLRILKKKLG